MNDRVPRRPNLLSVVMPVYNGAATVAEQLGALQNQTYSGAWELIVADNNSSDNTVEVVHSWVDHLPRLRIIEAVDGQGVSYASNAGAKVAGGDFVVFCHQDDQADPGWLEAMADAATGCDLVGGRMGFEKLNDPTTIAWRHQHPADRLPKAMGFLPFAIGANVGLWMDVFRDIGGWSEDLTWGGEDVEMCWRAQLAGYRLCFAQGAVIHFRYRSDPKALWRQFRSYGMAEPQLFRRYRHAGAPRSKTVSALKTWAWALVHLRDLAGSPEQKGTYLRKVAYRWGRLTGSVKSKVLYL